MKHRPLKPRNKFEFLGSCDEDNNCICNEEDLDLSDTITRELGGQNVFDYVKDKAREWKDAIKNSELGESLRNLAPSRCRIGNG